MFSISSVFLVLLLVLGSPFSSRDFLRDSASPCLRGEIWFWLRLGKRGEKQSLACCRANEIYCITEPFPCG